MKLKPIRIYLHVIFICIFLTSGGNSFAQSVFDLKGQRVIFPPSMPQYSAEGYRKATESVYVSDVLKKVDFNDKFLYASPIEGEVVSVIDVRHINPNKKKKEAILLILDHNGTEVIYYIPMRYESNINKSFRAFIVNDKNAKTWSGDINLNYKECDLDDIDIVFYNADSIQSAIRYLQDKELWPVIRKNSIDELIVPGNCPLQFVEFKFEDSNKLNTRHLGSQILHGIFKESDGNILKEKFMHRKELPGITYTADHETTLTDISSLFITKDEMKLRCEHLVNRSPKLIRLKDSILSLYKNKEVYIDNGKIPDRVSRLAYNLSDNEMKHEAWKNEYFTLSDIQILPIPNNLPHHANYAILIDSCSKQYALPIATSFFEYVIDGKLHKQQTEQQLSEDARYRDALRIEKLKQEQEYENDLIRKYGRMNAKLILKREIALGFSENMVSLAWGSPDDITTITNSFGRIQTWIYYSGSFVYFKDGKVIQIIN